MICRDMTPNEKVLYEILVNSQDARNSNWEAVRMFYKKQYNIILPELKDLPTIWTIERSIRTLKGMYHECTDEESKKIKEEQIDKYKQQALEKPMKEEQIELVWWDVKNG